MGNRKAYNLWIVLVFFVCAQVASAQQDSFQLYRNKDYMFRIKFPPGWLVMKGDGEHVVQKAIEEMTGASVGIVVKKNLTGVPTAKELQELASEDIPWLSAIDPKATVLEKRATYLLNRPAIFLKGNISVRHLDQVLDSTVLMFVVYTEKYLYFINCGSPSFLFELYEPDFMKSVNSFVVEDYSSPVVGAQEQWTFFSLGLDKSSSYFFKPSSVKRLSDGRVEVTVKTVFSEVEGKKPNYSHYIETWELGCAVDLYRMTNIEPYDLLNNKLPLTSELQALFQSLRADPKKGWGDVPRSSHVYSLIERLCAK